MGRAAQHRSQIPMLRSSQSNKEKSFEREMRALCGAKLTNFNKSSAALAHIRTLHQAATTAFGSDFMTYYDLFKLTKDKM